MRDRPFRCISLPLFFALALAIAPLAAQAADSTGDDDWRYGASIYLWGAGIKGKTASGFGGRSADFDVDFDDVLKNLNMAFMGAFEVRKSRWSLLADVIYLNAGIDKAAHVSVPFVPGSSSRIKVDADLKTKVWLVNLVGGYNVWSADRGSLDAIAGARYANVKLDLRPGANLGRFSASADLSPSVTVWDAVIGARGHLNLYEQWYAPYYVDVGTGQSDFTWQALAGLGYRFKWGDVSLSYRHIGWNYPSKEEIKNFKLSGPLLAATFHF